MLCQKPHIYAMLIGLHHCKWMTESIILGITPNAMLMKEVTLKYVTVLEFAQLFSHKFLIESLPKILLQGIF